MSLSPRTILKQYWNHDAFRPLQEDIINSVLTGRDALALLPTGGGKSLCFQVPAMAKPGLCLVVSPLISLMKDQTDRLRRKNITAFALYSGMNRKEVANILQLAAHSNCKFLYVSPERLETLQFQEHLASLPVNLVAVDEAHCVSQWGYDFRPPYLRIAALRERIEAPMLALTASATPEVLADITEKLQLKDHAIFRGPFTRPNLSYSFFSTDAKVQKAADVLQKVPGSGIIYCSTRKATKEIADQLGRLSIPAGAYHAGLSREERGNIQDAWLKDRLRVIVSTNAFGMGIDKPDVRTVIHFHPPESVESDASDRMAASDVVAESDTASDAASDAVGSSGAVGVSGVAGVAGVAGVGGVGDVVGDAWSPDGPGGPADPGDSDEPEAPSSAVGPPPREL